MQSTDIPTKIPLPFGTNAGANYTRTIPATTATQGRASFDQGFPPECFVQASAGGFPPDGRDENGLLLQMTQWLRWAQAGSAAIKYDGTFSTVVGGYPKGAILASTTLGTWWVSTADNNTTNPDGGSPANWTNLATFIAGGLSGFYLPISGGTLTGNLIVSPAAGSSIITADAPASTIRSFRFTTAGVLRNQLITNSTAETGANAGSNLQCIAYNDNGTVAGSYFNGTRSTQVVAFPQSPTGPTPAAGDNSSKFAPTAYVDDSPFGYNMTAHVGGHTIGTLASTITYTNTVGATKFVFASCTSSANAANLVPKLNGTTAPIMGQQTNGSAMFVVLFVPPGATYSISVDVGTPSGTNWWEFY